MTSQHSEHGFAFTPCRPPMVGAQTWQQAMTDAGWRCECTGQCGRTHAKTEGRCGMEHGTAHRLAVVATDPLATVHDAAITTDLLALCAPCHTGAKRAATKAAQQKAADNPDQPDLFGDAA